MFQKKHKNFKAIFAVLRCSKPKILSVNQPMTDIFLRPPPQLFYCCYGSVRLTCRGSRSVATTWN